MRLWCITLCIYVGWALADQPLIHDSAGYQSGRYGDPPSQTYYSFDVTSPVFNYNTWRKDLIADADSSHLFLTLDYDGSGPYIFRDDDLSLVYAGTKFDYAMNARVQTINDTDYLTFWHGARNRGDSQGFCVFYDSTYHLRYNVTLRAPFAVDSDMHECEVTPSGSVLLTAYQDKSFDLTSLGGKEEDVLADGCFQDVDISTNEPIFSWCASDHFEPSLGFWNFTGVNRRRQQPAYDADILAGLSTTYTTSSGFDAYHLNSLQKVSRFLQQLSAVYILR